MNAWSAHIGRIGIFSCCLLLAVAADAAEFRSGEQVLIAADQTLQDDLYMTGDTLTIAGQVSGDVVATGRVIRIEGVVEGDLVAAGQVVEIVGEVRDDVRIAGLTLKLSADGRVGDDLFAAGFSFESEAGSRVGGRTGITGFQARLSGDHGEGLEASLVGLTIEGRILGDVEATVESQAGSAWWSRFIQSPIPIPSVPAGLTVGENAWIDGSLTYTSVGAAAVAAGAEIAGTVEHREPSVETPEKADWIERTADAGRRLIVLLLLGCGLLWLAPRSTRSMVESLMGRPVACSAWGFVTLLGAPVAVILVLVLTAVVSMAMGLLTLYPAVVLAVLIGGVIAVLIVGGLWLALAYGAPIVVGTGVGEWLLRRGRGSQPNRYLALLAGLVVVVAVGAVPFIGLLWQLAVVLLGLGTAALWVVGRWSRAAQPRGGVPQR